MTTQMTRRQKMQENAMREITNTKALPVFPNNQLCQTVENTESELRTQLGKNNSPFPNNSPTPNFLDHLKNNSPVRGRQKIE